MSRNIFSFIIFFQYFFIGVAFSNSFVHVGDLKLSGEAQTHASIEKISFGEHEIAIHQWSSREPLAQVMDSLARQVPSNTMAWSDDDFIRLHWTSVNGSYMLMINPLSEGRIEFYLSYLQANINIHHNFHTKALSVIPDQGFKQPQSITKIFQESNIKYERLMDVKDESAQSVSRSMLFVFTCPVDQLEELLRRSLIKNSWSLTESPTRRERLTQARSMAAVRLDQVLYMSLVEHLGRSYVYVNVSGMTKQ